MNIQTSSKKRTTRIERKPLYNLERKLRIRGFSNKTIKTYLFYNSKSLRFVNKNPKSATSDDIKKFLDYQIKRGVTNATLTTFLYKFIQKLLF